MHINVKEANQMLKYNEKPSKKLEQNGGTNTTTNIQGCTTGHTQAPATSHSNYIPLKFQKIFFI